MSRVIVVVSGKGGVGKTTIAINLAAALSQMGEDVVLFDANLRTPNASIHLGAPKLPITLHDVLENDAYIEEALYEHDSGVRILPAGVSLKDVRRADPEKMQDVFVQLRDIVNITIADAPASLGDEVMAVLKGGDEVLIVTNPELPAVTDALKTIGIAKKMHKKILGVVINKSHQDNLELSTKEVEALLEQPILAVVPAERAVKEALSMFSPFVKTHPRSKAAIEIVKLAHQLVNKPYTPEHVGLWARIFKK